jgi:AraC-like DNA-binding protein
MVRVLIGAVERAGCERNTFLTAAAIAPCVLDDRNARLTLAEYERAEHVALELSGDAALGLHMAEHVSSAAFDVLGHLSVHASTLRHAIQALTRYSGIVSDGVQPLLCEDGDVASLQVLGGNTNTTAGPREELAMHGLLRLIRLYAGPHVQPHAIYFACDAPIDSQHRAEYDRIFGRTLRFGHHVTSIEIEREWLDRSHVLENVELWSALQTLAERTLGRLARQTSTTARTTQHLAACGPACMPTMEQTAQHLGMSARSLRRRLAADGVTYKQLLEDAALAAAKRLLEEPRRTIQEVSYLLGFSTPISFHRAFKRWTGLTPTAYKRSC